jgi:hypothetical protein
MRAVSPSNKVNAAAVRFKDPLLDLVMDFATLETSL